MNTTTRPSALALLTDALVALMDPNPELAVELLQEAYDDAEQRGQGYIAEAIEDLIQGTPEEPNEWPLTVTDTVMDGIRAILREELAL